MILFTIDSCRADRFGVYGRDPSPTPVIDRWAETGTAFPNAYSTSAWTAPGLASILTGLYPPAHGINNRDRMGSPGLPTLSKIFGRAGYRTPNLNFFTFAPYYRHLGLGRIQRQHFTETEGEEVLNWLREYSDEAPFFLWYHTTIVHQPYQPGEARLPAARRELLKRPGLKAVMTGAIVPRGSTRFEPDDAPYLDRLYDGELGRMDALFERILEILGQKDFLAKTLIVLTADHGEELLDHGFVGHASTSLYAQLYEEFIRIPLIISFPGRVPSNTDERLVNQNDILPSVLNLVGLPLPQLIDGSDLFQPIGERPLFFESVIAGNQTGKANEDVWVRAIRKGNLKYISRGELYRLDVDRRERNNLILELPEVAARMEKELNEWLRASRKRGQEGTPTEPRTHSSAKTGACPNIHNPGAGQALDYDRLTGSLLFDWSGDLSTIYTIEYDIGTGDHHVAGVYEVEGNHQLLGPFPKELWTSLKAWNPFKIRVSPKAEPPCWSDWVEFRF